MYQIRNYFTVLFILMLITGCATKQTADVSEFSGYLGNYDKLTETTDEREQQVLRYIKPGIKDGNYTKIIVDDVVFYPSIDETALADVEAKGHITKEALIKIRDYTNEALRREVGKVMTLTDQPGPDTLRIRVALTGLSASTQELAVYEYVPVALVLAGVATVIGERDLDTFVITEGELLKSDTGERLFMSVRKSKAVEQLKDSKEPLTADHVRQVIDDSGEEVGLWLKKNVVN